MKARTRLQEVVQWSLCLSLCIIVLVGGVVSLLGAFANPVNAAQIIIGALIVAISSFALTLLAKMLGPG